MLGKLQNLTNPWNNWKTKTYKDNLLERDADKIINLFNNPTELKKYFEENELPQQKESLRALYERVIERMQVDKKWKNQLNDFIKSERELLKNERFAENLLSVIRKNEIKELAYRLKKALGFEKQIKDAIEKYQLEREEYEFLYKALLEILPEREAKILNHNRDMLTIRKDSSILWKEFKHLFNEKKKTHLLKELDEAKKDYERIKALEKNVKEQKQKTETRIENITKELKKMESKHSNTSSVSSVQTEVKKEQHKAVQQTNEKIENVYETIAKKPPAPKKEKPISEPKPLVSKKENKHSKPKERNELKTPHSSSHVSSGVPLTKVKKEEPVVTPVLEEKVEPKKKITEEKVVQVPVTEEKIQENKKPTITEESVSEETPYMGSSIPDFGELEGVNQGDSTFVDFDAENYQDQHEYEIPYVSSGIPSYHDLEEVEVEEKNNEEQVKKEVKNQENPLSLNEKEDPDKDLNDLIWNDKN